ASHSVSYRVKVHVYLRLGKEKGDSEGTRTVLLSEAEGCGAVGVGLVKFIRTESDCRFRLWGYKSSKSSATSFNACASFTQSSRSLASFTKRHRIPHWSFVA